MRELDILRDHRCSTPRKCIWRPEYDAYLQAQHFGGLRVTRKLLLRTRGFPRLITCARHLSHESCCGCDEKAEQNGAQNSTRPKVAPAGTLPNQGDPKGSLYMFDEVDLLKRVYGRFDLMSWLSPVGRGKLPNFGAIPITTVESSWMADI